MKKGISLLISALLAVSAMPLTTSAQTQADFNGDGLVNGYDVNFIIEKYMERSVQEYTSPLLTDEIRAQLESSADLSGDGIVDMLDATMLIDDIKKNNKLGDINCDGYIDGVDSTAILYYYARKAVNGGFAKEERWIEIGVSALGDYDGNGIIDGRDSSMVLKVYIDESTGKN